MEISCILAPNADTPDHIALAEDLGYDRAWCFDTPALCSDVWMTLAVAATRTSRIGLAPGMLIPSLRHVVTNAAAIRTLAVLAPGRVSIGVGSGLTGRRLVGQGAMKWADVARYVDQLRTLLRGDAIVVEDKLVTTMAPKAFRGIGTIEVPVVLAVEGPRGIATAIEVGADGVATNGPIPAEFSWGMRVTFASVLDDGESVVGDRAWGEAGPGAALVYHLMYDMQGAAGVDVLPGGADWRKAIEAVPAEIRHQAHWQGHLVELSPIDEATIPREMAAQFATIGSAEEVGRRVHALAADGVTEIGFTPSGHDIPGQLRRFAAATIGATGA